MQTHGDWQVNGPAKPWPPHCAHRAPPPVVGGADEVAAAVVETLEEVVEVRRVEDEVTGRTVDEVAGLVLEELPPPTGGRTTDPASKVEFMAPTLMLE